MDFFGIQTKEARKAGGPVEVYPDFTVGRANDLMVQGGAFYAVWDEEKGLWSRDEYDVQRLVDKEIREFVEKMEADGVACTPRYLRSFQTNGWKSFRTFMKNVSDNSHPLDSRITFANTPVKKRDYASRRLPYELTKGSTAAYDELISRLYTPEEREKFEWGIGSIIAGDAKNIQKFFVFYGPGGTGKSTVMDIAEKIFGGLVRDGGYVAMFDAKSLVGNNNAFATESFKDNPLIAIQHDGDLSKIEDNSKFNSLVSHENLRVNEKYKATYDTRINAMLFMGTNKPVRITDAKSGMIRRLIDVRPTGEKHEINRYYTLMAQVEFELGAIAHHCVEVYRRLGKTYYNGYRPIDMMLQTDVFFNFIESYYDIFKAQNGTTLKQAYVLYKEYCKESELDFVLPQYKFRDELKNYFDEFHDRGMFDGVQARSFYVGFNAQPFKTPMVVSVQGAKTYSLVLDEAESILDEMCADLPAQYGKADETPQSKWESVKTTLADLDTRQLHFVKLPENHIVIDFDLKDEDGRKDLQRNLEAASQWPPTYAELSKSGGGVHLHYLLDGIDPGELAPVYSEGVEIKVFRGGSSLRRRLSRSNAVAVAHLSSGLPFKEKKPMLDQKTVQSEKGLRDLIARNLRKEIHPGTKPSIEFIYKILEDTHKGGMVYDVSDMRPAIIEFANDSTNHAMLCLKAVTKMKFKSEAGMEELPQVTPKAGDPVVIFDCEVYQNLFVLCWSYEDSDIVVRMINPDAKAVESLFIYKLVGFHNRGYDNHILWARMMGYDNLELYELSKRIIANDRNAMFGEAYSLSYADIYDFSTKKQGLKKWMIDLGMHHMEMDIPWDQPVADKDIPRVVEYCVNDVLGTKAAWKHLQADFTARQIMAQMSGLTVNDTTRNHAARIIFNGDRNPQTEFIYTDLSEQFPGYVYDYGKSTYRGIEVGEGGYVYAEPGMYENVALLDVASMHPTSIIQLHLFGKYTDNFANLYYGRLAIKRAMTSWKDGEDGKAEEFVAEASKYLPGLEITKENAKALSDALKLVLNSVYGYTSATFPNPFRDIRNVDNIVAKRGALFMIDLEYFIEERGFQVVHIKTDSVKIPNATPEIIAEIVEFGRRYGYEFEHEKTYEKFCLVNDAVYIARSEGKWDAVGAQFQHPVVFKALFSGETISFDDLCETKQVTSPSVMYLDFGENEATPAAPHKGMHHVGRIGRFLPVYADQGGADLVRVKDDKFYAVSNTKGHKWLEAEMVRILNLDAVERLLFDDLLLGVAGGLTDVVDMRYYEELVFQAQQTIEKFGDYHQFVK
jgi:hypothetical protein